MITGCRSVVEVEVESVLSSSHTVTLKGYLIHVCIFQPVDSRPVSFPSLLSHMTSTILNHEVLALPVLPRKHGVPPIRTFAPLAGTLPCDFHLLNLRSIQSPVNESPGRKMCVSIDFTCCETDEDFQFVNGEKNFHFKCLRSCGLVVLLAVFGGGFIFTDFYSVSFHVLQQDAHSPSPYTALLLHRLGLDCGVETQNPGFNCSTTQGQVSVLLTKT